MVNNVMGHIIFLNLKYCLFENWLELKHGQQDIVLNIGHILND